MTAATQQPSILSLPAKKNADRVRVYQHSDLLYWWVVWAYGYLCALLTRLQGVEVTLMEGSRPVRMHPSAWVGVSFTILVLFVLVFTNARARGVKSLVLFLLLMVLGLMVQITYGWNEIFRFVPLLLVHMNLGFYVLFSSVLLVAWLFVILFGDRLTFWEFSPGLISKRFLFSEGGESFATPQVETSRQSDDIFVHRVLGLWFLGFGTGDLEVRFSTPGGGHRTYNLRNVWRVGAIEDQIKRLVSKQSAAQAR